MVSDRGSQFVSTFWKTLLDRLRVDGRLSSAYHPQTDGQSENSNQLMEQYLRAYVNYLQDDWVKWLPAAEFAVNNRESATTKCTPFFANYGRHPRMGFEPSQPRTLTGPPRFDAEDADKFAQEMETLHTELQDQMAFAQARYEAYGAGVPPPAFQPGDNVWLDARNIRTLRPAKKLDYKNLGPFKVLQKINAQAYRIDLPETMRIHNVFHVSLLRPAVPDEQCLPAQVKARQPPPPVVAKEAEEAQYVVQEVVDSEIIEKKKRGKKRTTKTLHYTVMWEGYTEATLEPWYNLIDCPAKVKAFHDRYGDTKPGPHKDYRFDEDDQVAPEADSHLPVTEDTLDR